MTLREVAVSMGMTQMGVCHWEKFHAVPSARQVERLAEIYGCDAETLLGQVADGIAAVTRTQWLLGRQREPAPVRPFRRGDGEREARIQGHRRRVLDEMFGGTV